MLRHLLKYCRSDPDVKGPGGEPIRPPNVVSGGLQGDEGDIVTEPAGEGRPDGRGEPPPWGTPPPPTRRRGWGQPPAWQPPPQRRAGCGGCLLALVTVTVWFFVALTPLGFADDVVGPVTSVRWSTPVNSSTRDPAQPDQEVTVPVGSRMYVTAEAAQWLSIDCEAGEPQGGWRPLTPLPVPAGKEGDDEIRLFEFVATESTVRLRCSGGDEFSWVILWRDDDAARLRYTVLVNAARAGWLTSFTALILTPSVIRRVRRNRAARAAPTLTG
jgi:hypothetical protein